MGTPDTRASSAVKGWTSLSDGAIKTSRYRTGLGASLGVRSGHNTILDGLRAFNSPAICRCDAPTFSVTACQSGYWMKSATSVSSIFEQMLLMTCNPFASVMGPMMPARRCVGEIPFRPLKTARSSEDAGVNNRSETPLGTTWTGMCGNSALTFFLRNLAGTMIALANESDRMASLRLAPSRYSSWWCRWTTIGNGVEHRLQGVCVTGLVRID